MRSHTNHRWILLNDNVAGIPRGRVINSDGAFGALFRIVSWFTFRVQKHPKPPLSHILLTP